MAWEWVGPVSTAAVGIAGIAGTSLTGKSSRDQVLELTRRQERREVYLDFLSSVAEFDAAAMVDLVGSLTTADAKTYAAREALIRQRYFGVALVGPPLVADAAEALLKDVNRVLDEALEAKLSPGAISGTLLAKVHTEMAAILGYLWTPEQLRAADQLRTSDDD
jgi:hypothetical protein